jgi:hypothetical protein
LLRGYFEKTAYYHGAFLSFVIAAAVLYPVLDDFERQFQLAASALSRPAGPGIPDQTRDQGAASDEIDYADTFKLSEIDTRIAPYHLINTALNVPGSTFANRRGRNADFFVFSQRYIGSEATGYVETPAADERSSTDSISERPWRSRGAPPRQTWDGVDTATVADDRAAECPAWPLDPSPAGHRHAQGEAEVGGEGSVLAHTAAPPISCTRRFRRRGVSVEQLDARTIRKRRGFVFLTDGGHIDNLGVYELLRRRCKLDHRRDRPARLDPIRLGASLVRSSVRAKSI